MQKKRLYYGWIVAIACFFFELVMLGLANGTTSQYIKPICDDLGYSRGMYSMVYTFMSVSSMLALLAFGKAMDRLKDVRLFFLIGFLCLSVSFFIYRNAHSLPMFFLGGVLSGIAIAWSATVPLSIIVSNWFVRMRGTVLGLVFAGSGIGGMLLNPLVGKWISERGWRDAYGYSLLIVIAICVPALLLIRGNPEKMGLKPFGAEEGPAGAEHRDSAVSSVRMPQPAVHVRPTRTQGLLIGLAVFLYGLAIQPVFVNASPHYGGLGVPQKTVALIVSVIFISNAVSKVLLGAVNDRIGIRPVFLVSQVFFLVSAVILSLTKTATGGFAFALLYGIGYTVLSISTPLLAAHFYKGVEYGRKLGLLIAVQTAGSAVGTPIGGFCFDLFDSYVPSFLLQMVLAGAGTLLMMRMTKQRMIPDRRTNTDPV